LFFYRSNNELLSNGDEEGKISAALLRQFLENYFQEELDARRDIMAAG